MIVNQFVKISEKVIVLKLFYFHFIVFINFYGSYWKLKESLYMDRKSYLKQRDRQTDICVSRQTEIDRVF